PTSPTQPPSPPTTHPLSLHDALPISPGTDPTLVSTAEDEQGQPARRATPKPTPNIAAENERKLEQLSTDFAQLNRKLTALEKERSEEHTSELQSPYELVCRLLLEKKQ